MEAVSPSPRAAIPVPGLGAGVARAQPPDGPSTDRVLALPTLWPRMLVRRGRAPAAAPFNDASATWFYFARNAVWSAVRQLGLEGQEILAPAYHHGVEIEALLDAGARVAFYPVDRQMRLDLTALERRIGPRTRAIYLIHYAGFPGPSAAVRSLCDQRGLAMIEDCALALFSRDGQAPLGSHGDARIFCLYKTLPVPHGGALVMARENGRPTALEDPPLAATARHVASSLVANLRLRPAARHLAEAARTVGRSAGRLTSNVATGTQHFDRAHARLGMSALVHRIAGAHDPVEVVAARRRNYLALRDGLRAVSPPVFAELPAGVCPLFYPLRVEHKAQVAAELQRQGVETVDFWSVGHPSCELDSHPEVAELRRTILEIPCHQDLSAETVSTLADRVIDAVRRTS